MRFVIFCLFLVSCGESDVCYGPEGTFFGIPKLEMNSCIGSSPFLRETILYTEKLSSEKKVCGWHKLITEEKRVDSCNRRVTNSIDVKESGYKGTVLLEVNCDNLDSCASVWKVQFELKWRDK